MSTSLKPTKVTLLYRYEDTDLILRHIIEDGLDSPRGRLALGRLNHIHGMYHISNEDFLYVLSTFIFEPPRFFSLYGWRVFTETEAEAYFQTWLEIGQFMGIQDIPASRNALETWSADYEKRNRRFEATNYFVAAPTLGLLTTAAPWGLKNVVKLTVVGLLEPPLAIALGLEQSWATRCAGACASGLLCARSFTIRWLGLPLTTPRRRTSPESPASVASTTKKPPVSGDSSSKEREAVWGGRLKTLFSYSTVKMATYPNGYCLGELGPEKSIPYASAPLVGPQGITSKAAPEFLVT